MEKAQPYNIEQRIQILSIEGILEKLFRAEIFMNRVSIKIRQCDTERQRQYITRLVIFNPPYEY